MIRPVCVLLLLGFTLSGPAWGQNTNGFDFSDDPFAEGVRESQPAKPSTPGTPESYSSTYEQIPDARTLVFRNAASKAAQRRHRMASLKWYGYSNLRPIASPMPNYNTYSPMWAGNTWDAYRWVGFYAMGAY